VQTDRTTPINKPNIIIRENEKGTCVLTDTAISGFRNVIKIEAEIIKYKHLTKETKRMWNAKKVIPIIINKDNQNNLKIIHKIRKQLTRKA